MKKRILNCLSILAIFLVINSCKKTDLNNSDNGNNGTNTVVKITTIVAGIVVDEAGNAINGATISIGSATVTTNNYGNFIIPKASINKNAGVVIASKSGYFSSSSTISSKENVINNLAIKLIKKNSSGSFNSNTGGVINPSQGGSIAFPANAVVQSNGTTYSGNVIVYAYYLDPSKPNFYDKMPGSLRGVTLDNNEVALTSYGMMVVELKGVNGETLQLATGKNATLTIPISTNYVSTAPNTIKLWYFNDSTGMWAEQGMATKVGNKYVGTVAHFSWWNFDLGVVPIKYTAKFIDQNGNPISNAHVYFLPTDSSKGGGHGYTASDGSIIGNIPINTPITVSMYITVSCIGYNEILVYIQKLNQLNSNTDGGTITVNISKSVASLVQINGNVVDCNTNPVTDGYASLNIGGRNVNVKVNNGSFKGTIMRCDTIPVTVSVDVYDIKANQINGLPISISNVTAGNYDVGKVSACGTIAYINYSLKILNQNGNPVDFSYCIFTSLRDTLTVYADSGNIFAKIPFNQKVKMRVYTSNGCLSGNIFDTTIGPFSTNTNAGSINVYSTPIPPFYISGMVNDCNGNPVTNGTLSVLNDSFINGVYKQVAITNGNFSIPIKICDYYTFYFVFRDNLTIQENSKSISVRVNPNNTNNINLGTISACGLLTNQFFNYTFDGNVINCNVSSLYSSTRKGAYFRGSLHPTDSLWSTNKFASDTGNYPLEFIYLFRNNSEYNNVLGNIKITEYGKKGQYLSGSFSGNVSKDTSSLTKPISGSFRIKVGS